MLKKSLFAFVLAISFLAVGCTKTVAPTAPDHAPVHIDITADGAVYQKALKEHSAELAAFRATLSAPMQLELFAIDDVLRMGERNLDWLKHINSKIASEQKLSFSSKATMTGYPMDKPSRYSEKRVLERFETAKSEMPREMFEIIIKGKPFTDEPPIELAKYLEWGLKIDRIYQSAARWLLVQPYQWQYKSMRIKDVRGYYFLSVEPDLANKLANFSQLAEADRTRLSEWLVLLCFNTAGSMASCKSSLNTYITQNNVPNFYSRYEPRGKALFQSFFNIGARRYDIVWNSNKPNVLNFPFRDPNHVAVADFLKVNIEDEWKWGDWKLLLNFTSDALTHVEFEAGTTPHVNGLAGNTITMDANAPLTEYDVQWTIRHEFGHVLGFPDCYIEFYEEETGDMVNYQIDTTNLMCSRMGALQEKHFNEMKRTYFDK